MKVAKFSWYDDHRHGENSGWVMEGIPDFAGTFGMLEGMGVAHDILEHTHASRVGTFADEVRACGAMYYVRGETGYWAQRGGTGSLENIASTFGDIYLYYFKNRGTSPYTAKFPKSRDPHEVRENMQEILKKTKVWRDESLDIMHNSQKDELLRAIRPLEEQFENLMLAGYNWAAKRYEKLGQWNVCALFQQIETNFNEAVKYMDTVFEGQTKPYDVDEIHIHYTLSKWLDPEVKLIKPEEDWY